MNELYRTEITDKRWIVYDILGNLGWIMYLAGLIFCCVKEQCMQNKMILAVIVLAVIPAVAMIVGIIELVNERINKLDRLLPKKRLLRGFGALTFGGVSGTLISGIAMVLDFIFNQEVNVNFIIMCIGGILCGIFAYLLYKGYRKCEK